MLEAGVEVGLLLKTDDALEVGVVDMGVHPEQALEDGPHHALKVVGKRLACNAGSSEEKGKEAYTRSLHKLLLDKWASKCNETAVSLDLT